MSPRARTHRQGDRAGRDVDCHGEAIRFGTSGWRGVLGEEVTFPRLRILVRAVARWVADQAQGDRVLIGWDGRFASRAMAEMAAQMLAQAGLQPVLARSRTATPVITHALARGRAAAGLVLTASHNPPEYHGLKVFQASGAAISDQQARRIESYCTAENGTVEASTPDARIPRRDLAARYRRRLAGFVDAGAVARSRLQVHYDAMHGAGAGVLDSVLEDAGVPLQGYRLWPDPHFGGSAPDPAPDRLGHLSAQLQRSTGLAIGLATDGDADRIAVVDGRGRFLTETQTIALLVDHLATQGQIKRGIAITQGTGSLVEKVALAHGLPVSRHPVGFKFLSAELEAGRADLAGEESGGFALARMGLDKDGMLAACLMVNRVATSGEPVELHLERLEERFGRSACGRAAIDQASLPANALAAMDRRPPDRVGRTAVTDVDRLCGLRLGLADGGFLILRASGTEPVVRVYAEAGTPGGLAQRLRQGIALLKGTGK